MGIQEHQLVTCFLWVKRYWVVAIRVLDRPIRAGEMRSHSAGYEPNAPYAPCGPRNMRENRGRSPRAGNAGILGQSIRMVGQFLQVRQSDNEQMASRVTFELEEQTAASSSRGTELERMNMPKRPMHFEQNCPKRPHRRFQYLEHQQNIFAQARLRTVESALAARLRIRKCAAELAAAIPHTGRGTAQ